MFTGCFRCFFDSPLSLELFKSFKSSALKNVYLPKLIYAQNNRVSFMAYTAIYQRPSIAYEF